MKAISFFCVVFVSMLTAFLIATGEVQRWFSGKEEPRQLVFNNPPTSPSASANMLYFPFYNVELGKLSFTIRAELSQDDLEVKDKFDEIRHLTLRNGSLDIPVYDGLVLGSTAAPGEDPDGEDEQRGGTSNPSPQQITLTFETAEWQRPPAKGDSGRDGMKVALTNGRGTTNDGFSFFFEELLFEYRGAKDEDDYHVSSSQKVSIKNQAFELHSPSGLRGKLRGDGIGLESLTFLPPVTAVIDRKRAPFFQYATRSDAAEEGESRSQDQDDEPGEEGAHRVVITSQGNLDLTALQPEEDEPRRTMIAFHDDVTIRPQASGDRATAADTSQTRFECQYLELTFREVRRRLMPDRALATWEGGRVKAYFDQKGRKKEGYVVDGERLEWNYRAPPDGTAPEAATRDASHGTSEAVLYGNPTLTGGGHSFQARRALLDLAEGRVFLDGVSGRFRIARRSETKRRAEPRERSPQALGVEGPRAHGRETTTLPEHWNMKADEMEFFFATSGGDAQRLSHFIARSRRPGEVVVESELKEPEAAGGGGDVAGQLRLTASHVAYRNEEKMITFAGTPEAKPDFSQGENRIESRRIRLLLEKDEELAFFEEEVRARIVDTDRLAAVTGSGVDSRAPDRPDERRKNDNEESKREDVRGVSPADESERRRGPEGPVELSADMLTVGLDQGTRSISFLQARGGDAAPARINSTTGSHFVIEGAELEWNRRDESAIVWGTPPGPAGRPSVGAPLHSLERADSASGARRSDEIVPAPPPLARLEFEGGQLQAERISFDQKSQTAYLETHVVLECREGASSIVVHTGRAEVELFGADSVKSPAADGILGDLRKVRAFRALRSEDSPIELIGEHFRAYADDAVWDAATSELRFVGGEKQEIRIANEHFKGPIYAREVVYNVKNDLLTLRGEVEGRLTQHLSRARGKHAGPPMEWRFETSRLELQLHAAAEDDSPKLRSLHAREWVHLTSIREDLALRLLGDALDYDALSGKVRIYSPAGRPQTFFRVDPRATGAQSSTAARSAPVDNRDEIIAQEILLLPFENPDARFGESRSWLNVEFERNVKAVFRPPAKPRQRKSSTRSIRLQSDEPWKLDADKLVLRVDPGQAAAGMVTWATAHGSVVFKSGAYSATGDRAEYKDASQTLILTGAPARLSGEDRNGRPYTYENERIVIRKEGDHIAIQLENRPPRSKRR